MKKSFTILLILGVLGCSRPFSLRSEVKNRIKRDAPVSDKPATDERDLKQILISALTKFRTFASERLRADVDKVQAALNSGELQNALEQIKAEMAGENFDFHKIINLVKEKAPPELQEAVARIIAETQNARDKIHEKFHNLGKILDEKLKP